MDAEKIGNFIKEIRTKNGLTQKEFAEKYHVTYQAVSKWENGLNLPDMSLLKEISKDFNVSIDEILDGKKTKKKNLKMVILVIALLIVVVVAIIFSFKNRSTFSLKSITSSCEDFTIKGSIAYDNAKSAIYISDVSYCGEPNYEIYEKIECKLFENVGNESILITNCDSEEGNLTLEDYLHDLTLKIDEYFQKCKNYSNDSLYLKITATDKEGNTSNYKIPLNIDGCE